LLPQSIPVLVSICCTLLQSYSAFVALSLLSYLLAHFLCGKLALSSLLALEGKCRLFELRLDRKLFDILVQELDGIFASRPGLLSRFLKAFFRQLLVRKCLCLVCWIYLSFKEISLFEILALAGIALIVSQMAQI